ncbi:MAG TPA: nucleoside 2-deoxyribosyltransferase [Candidatus Brocadiia bacterium]|nr:nucleoside 2-deoxyribosyltransferase [Candidatus Brocadiia bacterium]
MVIYLSAPVFCQHERRWNRRIAELMQERIQDCRVILPQDFKVKGRYNDRKNFREIFDQCIAGIRQADVIIAVLDGADTDSGVALEVGFAYGLGKPIVGVRTDYRQNQFRGLNVMLAGACTEVCCEMAFQEDPAPLVSSLIERMPKAVRKTDT